FRGSRVVPFCLFLFLSRGAPVGKAHERFQPCEHEGPMPPEQSLGAGAPGWSLVAFAQFHDRESKPRLWDGFAVEVERGKLVAFPYAAREALTHVSFILPGLFVRQGTQSHAYFAVMCGDEVSDQVVSLVLSAVLQPGEHRSKLVAEVFAAMAPPAR